MKRNEALAQMLAEYRPDLGDSAQYMEHLSQRLAAVEVVKALYEREHRRHRSRLVVAFVAGGVAGVVMSLYFLMHPLQVSHHSMVASLLGWTAENLQWLCTVGIIALFGTLAAITATLFLSIAQRDYTL